MSKYIAEINFKARQKKYAPEMYEALKEFTEASWNSVVLSHCQMNAKSLISKIEGGESNHES